MRSKSILAEKQPIHDAFKSILAIDIKVNCVKYYETEGVIRDVNYFAVSRVLAYCKGIRSIQILQ